MFRFFAVLALCLGALPSHAAELVQHVPAPAWVLDEPVPPADPALAEEVFGSVDYRLVDRQLRWDGQTYQSYYRTVTHVQGRAGLERAARIAYDFDPAHERLLVHHVRLKRGEDWIDLTDRLEFQLLRRETELNDSWMIDGHLTALAYLEDVRIGDLIDIATSMVEEPIIARDHMITHTKASWGVPVGQMRFRLLMPDHRRLTISQPDSVAPPEIEQTATGRVYEWRRSGIAPVEDEDDTPVWYSASDWIGVTSMTGWDQVAADLTPVYAELYELPESFEAELAAATASAATDAGRMAAALHLVQQRIRYVGLELGDGAYFPRPPELTVARGYGDCKDVTVLLISALRHLGIEAHPVLAHTRTGHGIDPAFPTPYRFNHVMVVAEIDGRRHWLDPTISLQGGSGADVVRPNYGTVLPLKPGQSDLAQIPPLRSAGPNVHVEELFNFDGFDGATLTVTSIYRGAAADWRRRNLANRSRGEFARSLHDYYLVHYPGIEMQSLPEIRDDRPGNEIRVIERYTLDAGDLAEGELIENFPMRAVTLINVLKQPETRNRRAPVAQRFPLNRRHKVVFLNAPNTLDPGQSEVLSNDWLYYKMMPSARGNRLEVTWTLLTRTDEIPAKDVAAYRAAVDEIEDLATWWWPVGDLPEPAETDAAQAAVTEPDRPNLFDRLKSFMTLPETLQTETLQTETVQTETAQTQ